MRRTTIVAIATGLTLGGAMMSSPSEAGQKAAQVAPTPQGCRSTTTASTAGRTTKFIEAAHTNGGISAGRTIRRVLLRRRGARLGGSRGSARSAVALPRLSGHL
jgi:hypothetical protein